LPDLAAAEPLQCKKPKKKQNHLEGLILHGAHDQFPRECDVIVGRDPGYSNGTCGILIRGSRLVTRKRGLFTFECPPVLWAQHNLTHLPPLHPPHTRYAIVTEGQWLKGPAKERAGVLKLAARSGRWQGGECFRCDAPGYEIPVPIWKSLIFGGPQTDKYVHCNWIKAALTREEKDLLPIGAGQHDVLSAIGIAWAAWLLRFDIAKFREI
jgi:hypothetical protein